MLLKGRLKVSLRLKVIITIFLVYVTVITGFVLPSMWHQRQVLEKETGEASTMLVGLSSIWPKWRLQRNYFQPFCIPLRLCKPLRIEVGSALIWGVEKALVGPYLSIEA